ncbi:hypothetical protein M3Y97_00556700 [Aphelenchoides bicaudatus]|nr:hypothetical protein M3Y97_00556700 [Aphelenchoides bicaudatus]
MYLHEPEDISELIVNKKKIEEVRTWMQNKIQNEFGNKLLLITGPSGCGKSSTVRLICDELDIEFTEFEFGSQLNANDNLDLEDGIVQESQLDAFRNFIIRSQNKTVEGRSRTRKLIIVKELPVMMINDPSRFYVFLREILPHMTTFLVFSFAIIGTSWDFSPFRIFPDSVLIEFNIHHIKFNAIPKTVMSKKVQKWIGEMKIPVNKKFVETVISKANGDLRSAMSVLQISCVDKKKFNADFLIPSDPSVDLFHFLGKILYAKRSEDADEEWARLESKLSDKVKPIYRREFPPKNDVSMLMQASSLSNSALIDFIMEHEPNFNKKPKQLTKVYEDVCRITAMGSSFEFQIHPEINKVNRQTIIRSVTFNNYRANEKTAKVMQAALRIDFNAVYPSVNRVDTTTYTIPLLGKLKSHITEEEASLCKKIIPTVKINPERMHLAAPKRLMFEICNDSD